MRNKYFVAQNRVEGKMRKRPALNLFVNIAVLCLCVCAIAIGVYSVKNASLSVTGTIGFEAHNCEILINGTMQGYESSDNGKTTTAVTKYFNETNSEGGEALTLKEGTSNSWDLGTLYFDDLHTTGSKEVNDIIFTFEITNNSAFYVDVTLNREIIENDRIFVYAPNIGETLSPSTASEGNSVTLTMKFQLQRDSEGNYSSLGSTVKLLTDTPLLKFNKIDAPAYLASDFATKLASGFTGFDKASITKVSFVKELNASTLSGFVTENNSPKGVSVADTTKTDATDVLGYWNSTTQEVVIYSPARIYAPTGCGNMFSGYTKLTTTTFDNFDTSNTTYMSSMFSSTSSIDSLDLTSFDTSNVQRMGTMFGYSCGTSELVLDLRNFDTSKVTNMSLMFREFNGKQIIFSDNSGQTCTNFSDMFYGLKNDLLTELDLRSLNAQNGENFSWMFGNSSVTSIYFSDNFTTNNATNMSSMFYSCSKLTSLDLHMFDTSKVTTMKEMFAGCKSLLSIDVSTFNTYLVKDFRGVFRDCSSLTTLDLSNFDFTSAVYFGENGNGSYAFFGSCTNLTSIKFPTKQQDKHFGTKITDISGMFVGCSKLQTIDLSAFEFPDNLTHMGSMFSGCTSLTQIISLDKINMSNVSSMLNMFYNCSKLTDFSFINNFNTSNLVYASGMFYNCTNLSSSALSDNFDLTNVKYAIDMFNGCINIDSLHLNMQNVTNMSGMFNNCSSLTKIDLSDCDLSNVTQVGGYSSGHYSYLFGYCSNLEQIIFPSDTNKSFVGHVSSFERMFYECKKLKTIDLSTFKFTSSLKYMHSMFTNCTELSTIIFPSAENMDLSSVTSYSSMFAGCSSLTDFSFLSKFNTSGATSYQAMFSGCTAVDSIDLSSFVFDNVTSMHEMFNGCTNLKQITFPENLNTSKLTTISGLFKNCSSLLSIDLKNFDTSHIKSFDSLFRGCSSLTELDLSSFDTSSITRIDGMFNNCSKVKTIYVDSAKWGVPTSIQSSNIFDDCTLLVGGYTASPTIYNSSHRTALYARIDGGPDAPGYLTDIKAKPSA